MNLTLKERILKEFESAESFAASEMRKNINTMLEIVKSGRL